MYLRKILILLFPIIIIENGFGSHDAFWTLDHEHDIKFGLRKMRQQGFTVINETSTPATLTLTGVYADNISEKYTQCIQPNGSVAFDPELTYVDIDTAVGLKGKVHTNLIKQHGKYAIQISEKPAPFNLYGKPGFGFDFNYLKDAPVHRSEHRIHPKYFKEDNIDPKFLENDHYHKLKKAQLEFEQASTIQERKDKFDKLTKAEEAWEKWVKDYLDDGDEPRRKFLEGDELLYLRNVVREFDPSNGPRQEKRLQNLMDAIARFDNAPKEEREPAFASLVEAQMDWKKWAEQYNGNVWFLEERVLKETGIDRKKYTQILNDSYKTHNPQQMFEHFRHHPVKTSKFKIPPHTHTMWFTHPDNPCEFPYVEDLKRTTKACPKEQGFKHFLWVLDKTIMPKTVANLKGSDVEVMEMSEFGHYPLKNFVEEAVHKKRKMGMATDAFRAVLLKERGGIYMDSDFEALQSIAPWLHYYDGVFNLEPMSSFVGNAFFMVTPHHPVMEQYVEIIERNISPRSPKYIKDVMIEDPVYATISITGPGALTEAVATKIGLHGRKDIVLPHPFFYPSVNNIYPELDVHKSSKMPFFDVSWGVHKWHTTWDQKAFGSAG